MTLEKIKLVGDRVLVQLDEAKDHTITESGIVIPLNKVVETEGGRLKTETSPRKHYLQGTVLQIAPLSKKRLEENLSSISVGDKVYVTSQTLGSNGYQFYPDRTKLVADFEGYVVIPHSMIEAKIEE